MPKSWLWTIFYDLEGFAFGISEFPLMADFVSYRLCVAFAYSFWRIIRRERLDFVWGKTKGKDEDFPYRFWSDIWPWFQEILLIDIKTHVIFSESQKICAIMCAWLCRLSEELGRMRLLLQYWYAII